MKYCKGGSCSLKAKCDRYTGAYIKNHRTYIENNLNLIDSFECINNEYKYLKEVKEVKDEKEKTTKRY